MSFASKPKDPKHDMRMRRCWRRRRAREQRRRAQPATAVDFEVAVRRLVDGAKFDDWDARGLLYALGKHPTKGEMEDLVQRKVTEWYQARTRSLRISQ